LNTFESLLNFPQTSKKHRENSKTNEEPLKTFQIPVAGQGVSGDMAVAGQQFEMFLKLDVLQLHPNLQNKFKNLQPTSKNKLKACQSLLKACQSHL